MKKILVILTGGTIGSESDENSINVSSNNCIMLDIYKSKYDCDYDFDTITAMNILSENITSSDWQKLIDVLYNVDTSIYKGIIITHGSDTLAYTSALIGIAFSKTNIPIVLTASNLPPENPDSNCLPNLHTAITMIDKSSCGVYTAYQDNCGNNNIYLSTRITPAELYTDEFGCFGDIYAKERNGNIKYITSPKNPTVDDIKTKTIRCPKININRKVLLINPYPTIDYSTYTLTNDTVAILHTLYHSSTAPTCDNSHLLDFIVECKSKGIDFYICPFREKSQQYITANALINSGAIPLNNISVSTAYSKLYAAYSQNEILPQEFMKQTFFFEVLN